MTEHAWSTGGRRPWRARLPLLVPRPLVEAAVAAVVATGVGALVATHLAVAVVAVALLGALWVLVRPNIAAMALGASIPAVENLTGGSVGLNISLSDLMLVLLVVAVLGAALRSRGAELRALRPIAVPLLQYCGFIAILLAAHLELQSGIKSFQRLELLLFPLAVGSYLALRGAHVRLLQAYVLAATALALIWPLDHLQLQKNPTGQLFANAIVLLVALPRLARLRICTPVLVYGLLATASRGAIVACAIGLACALLAQGLRAPWRTAGRVAVLAAVVVAMFQLMPPDVRARVTSYGSSGGPGNAAFTIRVRAQYRSDAIEIASRHPWFGVGVGSYLAGVNEYQLTQARDPHNVVLLQAAEGGWGFAVSFVLLAGGTILALVRRRYLELAPAALGVFVGTLAHGLVDVFWVRGTPVLGWLLVGMVCAQAYRTRAEVRS